MRTICLLFVLFQVSWSLSSAAPPSHLCLPHQRAALLHFKNTTSLSDDCGTDSWNKPGAETRTDSWNKSIDCCSWDGVECDYLTGHVIGIHLSHSCLEGPLLANNSLFHLHSLQWLDLSSNQLNGSILDNTSSLPHLHNLQQLDLSLNDFEGAISSELFTQLVSLTHLNLSYNPFYGLIPSQISLLSSLVSLDLTTNRNDFPKLRFDGRGFEMLSRNLTKLTNLVLDYVNMSDVSVTSFQNLSSSLQTLSLRGCDLQGEFPSQVFQLPNLKHLDLGENEKLTGYLSNTNWSSSLELLDLYYCDFKGSIPASFGNLTQITSIDLSGNLFEGHIPDVFENLSNLTSLAFSFCNFSGPLPITAFNLSQITFLDLSNNHLEGPLPNHVSQLQFLKYLALYVNSISGGLPSWLFTLPSLTDLLLGHNKLAGPIDQVQKPSSSLQNVYLSGNGIYGPIPDSFSYLVNLGYLDLSSNNLSGVVKSDMLSKLTSLGTLDVSNNSLLSLSTSGNIDVNNSFPQLQRVYFSGCSVRQFPSFFRTSKLEILDLSNNKITGGISKWEAQGWEELRVLKISNNFVASLEQIPGKKLVFLDLNSNLLQGTILHLLIPTTQSLNGLLISNNNLTGDIPSSICNWTSLAVLDLSKNSLTGTIPECLGNFSYNLSSIDLVTYPTSGDGSGNVNLTLSHLFLNDNQLEGLVPKSLAHSSSLEILNLGNNKLSDQFPYWLASLPNLHVLILKSNRFHGSLPHSLASSNFSALRILNLSGNEFSGTLPTTLFKNLRAMSDSELLPSYGMSYLSSSQLDISYEISVDVTTKRLELQLTKNAAIFLSVDLSNNQFSGQIPEQVGQLVSVRMLNFSHNNFSGPIPASFGNLAALESLDLSSNKLGGKIPSQMTKLTFLSVLNLSGNNLVGPIPHGKQFSTFGNDSYICNLGLCGLPLSKQCDDHGGVQPPAPFVGDDEGSAAIPIFWKVVMMGYGTGVVLGVSLGYIVFTTGRPWWFIRKVERDWQPKFTEWMRGNMPKRN